MHVSRRMFVPLESLFRRSNCSMPTVGGSEFDIRSWAASARIGATSLEKKKIAQREKDLISDLRDREERYAITDKRIKEAFKRAGIKPVE
ncbi:MAG: hypothetical protein SNF33_02300 [Candidatus Algichlamydia australiensis]|nr:hypothetical protein [Chlamydiales bacterium]